LLSLGYAEFMTIAFQKRVKNNRPATPIAVPVESSDSTGPFPGESEDSPGPTRVFRVLSYVLRLSQKSIYAFSVRSSFDGGRRPDRKLSLRQHLSRCQFTPLLSRRKNCRSEKHCPNEPTCRLALGEVPVWWDPVTAGGRSGADVDPAGVRDRRRNECKACRLCSVWSSFGS